ncbi:MAG: hypothetical protein KG003_05750 [Bacteroidetes bacterium]|nr:hypothetical protein [Bacteroidota bacterium]
MKWILRYATILICFILPYRGYAQLKYGINGKYFDTLFTERLQSIFSKIYLAKFGDKVFTDTTEIIIQIPDPRYPKDSVAYMDSLAYELVSVQENTIWDFPDVQFEECKTDGNLLSWNTLNLAYNYKNASGISHRSMSKIIFQRHEIEAYLSAEDFNFLNRNFLMQYALLTAANGEYYQNKKNMFRDLASKYFDNYISLKFYSIMEDIYSNKIRLLKDGRALGLHEFRDSFRMDTAHFFAYAQISGTLYDLVYDFKKSRVRILYHDMYLDFDLNHENAHVKLLCDEVTSWKIYLPEFYKQE